MPTPDPRGPFRTIQESWANAKGNHYLLSCGHISEGASHFHLDPIGSERRCFACGREELAKWKEAN